MSKARQSAMHPFPGLQRVLGQVGRVRSETPSVWRKDIQGPGDGVRLRADLGPELGLWLATPLQGRMA